MKLKVCGITYFMSFWLLLLRGLYGRLFYKGRIEMDSIKFALVVAGATFIGLVYAEIRERKDKRSKEEAKRSLDRKWNEYFNKNFGVIDKEGK